MDDRGIATNLELAEEEMNRNVYENLTYPIALTVLFSLLLLPMPTYIGSFLFRRFNLEEIDEEDSDEDE